MGILLAPDGNIFSLKTRTAEPIELSHEDEEQIPQMGHWEWWWMWQIPNSGPCILPTEDTALCHGSECRAAALKFLVLGPLYPLKNDWGPPKSFFHVGDNDTYFQLNIPVRIPFHVNRNNILV